MGLGQEQRHKFRARQVYAAVSQPGIDPHPVARALFQLASRILHRAAARTPGQCQTGGRRDNRPFNNVVKVPATMTQHALSAEVP